MANLVSYVVPYRHLSNVQNAYCDDEKALSMLPNSLKLYIIQFEIFRNLMTGKGSWIQLFETNYPELPS